MLIDSTTNQPRELESIDDLLTSPSAGAGSAVGRPAGDARWPPATTSRPTRRAGPRSGSAPTFARTTGTPTSGRWQALRDGFLEMPQGVRFHLLAYPQAAPGNLAVRVTDVRRQKTGDGAELLVSLQARRARSGRATRKDGPGAIRDRRGAVRGDASSLTGPRAS